MEKETKNELRLVTLCRILGHLWSENDIVIVRQEIPTEKRIECSLTLYGKFLSKPNVNFHAFLNTMKKAWKTESITCHQNEPGFYSFAFETKDEKERMLQYDPWSFTSNLLVLKQCESEILEHCYNFSKNAFWAQIVEVPLGWFLEDIYRNLAERVGKVLEVQLASTRKSPYKIGKVKVEVDL
ncbi:hypothetical protein BT93_J0046 [Corymbia citriodora subsp. variegata]|nr:hypothetical protein BT93_J0046 [Corymbia citriodora subsp. variegata]